MCLDATGALVTCAGPHPTHLAEFRHSVEQVWLRVQRPADCCQQARCSWALQQQLLGLLAGRVLGCKVLQQLERHRGDLRSSRQQHNGKGLWIVRHGCCTAGHTGSCTCPRPAQTAWPSGTVLQQTNWVLRDTPGSCGRCSAAAAPAGAAPHTLSPSGPHRARQSPSSPQFWLP